MFEKFIAHLLEEHDYEDLIQILVKHVAWRNRRSLLDRAMARAGTGPPVAAAMRRWLEEEAISGVVGLAWHWMTTSDPRWSAMEDEIYRRAWAETIVMGYAVQRAPPALRVVEQVGMHDGIATRVINPALAPLLRVEFFDEIRAQLALRDQLLVRMPKAS
jgi:hypothetical protein